MLAGSRLACLDEARPKAERSLAGCAGRFPQLAAESWETRATGWPRGSRRVS